MEMEDVFKLAHRWQHKSYYLPCHLYEHTVTTTTTYTDFLTQPECY